jgi:hypothetical protein
MEGMIVAEVLMSSSHVLYHSATNFDVVVSDFVFITELSSSAAPKNALLRHGDRSSSSTIKSGLYIYIYNFH